MSELIKVPNMPAEGLDNNEWKNKDVIKWYKSIPTELLRDYSIKGGLENGCDIDIVYPFIANTGSLIEVGSAYGRVIKHLIRKGYQGKICGVECSENFYDYLKMHYSEDAEIILSEIQNFRPKSKVDVILWLWSGINDFEKAEHISILKHMCTWLNPNGVFILETLLHTLSPRNALINGDKVFMISTEYGNTYSYKTCKDEIQEYGDKLGFKYIKHIDYETSAHRQRILHFFSNRLI